MMPLRSRSALPSVALLLTLMLAAWGARPAAAQSAAPDQNLWRLAESNKAVHRFSTLFTAQDVKKHLSDEAGIDQAIDWCKKTAVSKVYIESFRGAYWAKRETLTHARDRFRQAGIEVSGCVTTTKVGKDTTGWKGTISCYTDPATQETLGRIFEYTASMFDEIMIDDFWFTDCACPECEKARAARTVTIGAKTFPVSGDAWADYRCELLVQLSRHNILEPARRVNPKVKIIIKYPQWYDNFHERGYEVLRETADFDRTWVGTETRDYNDPRWGGKAQYEGYFIMRWLGGIGGEKCGGGWFDPYGTTEATYIEQARQTILGGARESMLFCYGSLQQQTGPKNIEALRRNIPELFKIAAQVSRRQIVGVAAYKPANSDGDKEKWVFDFVGMTGLPLVPCHEFPEAAPAAFFSVHALKDADFAKKLDAFLKAGKPVLLTDGLAKRLGDAVSLKDPNVRVLAVKGQPKSLLELPQADLDALRAPLLKAAGLSLAAPNKVAFYPFQDGSWVLENFNDQPVEVKLNNETIKLEPRGWRYLWK